MSEETSDRAQPPSAGPRSAAPRSMAPAPRRLHLLQSDAFPLVLVALLAIGGLAVIWATSGAAPVHFVNGLADTLSIEIDGAAVAVPSGGHVEKQLDVGVHRVRVRAGEQHIEESTIYVPRFHDALVYDPLGLEIITKRRIRYSTAPSNVPGDDESAEIFAGQRWVVVEDADYVFREPPRQISTKQKSGSIEKTWVDAPAEATWQDTLGYLVSQGQLGTAAAILQAWATAPASFMPPEALQWAQGVPEMAHGPDAGLARLRQLRDLDTSNLEVHVAYQEAMLQLGRREALLAEYRQRTTQAPDSAADAVARCRIEPMSDTERLLELARARFPDDPSIRVGEAARRLHRGDVAGALRAFEAIQPEQMDPRHLPVRVRALVAAGQRSAAMQLVEDALLRAPQHPTLLLLRGQLEKLGGSSAEPRLSEDAAVAALLRTLLGGAAPATATPNAMERASQLQAKIIAAPADARSDVATAPAAALRAVHRSLATLLVAELERLGEWKSAERLRAAALDPRVERRDLLAFLFDGAESRELERLDDDSRSALDLVRARVLLESGDEDGAKRALAALKKRDVLAGPVSLALAAWPPPASSDAGLVVFAWRSAQR